MVAVRDGADEAEPEPVARRAAAGLEPDKAVEHGLAVGFGYAGPAIGHFEHGALAAVAHPDLQLAAIGIFQPRCRADWRAPATTDGGRRGFAHSGSIAKLSVNPFSSATGS